MSSNQETLNLSPFMAMIAYIPAVQEKLNVLKEVVEAYTEQFHFCTDPDARIGHKTADSSFFGFKTHIAMSDERLITAVILK
jgi:hypothetical protein